METFWHDLRYGLRMLIKSPGFTAVAVIALALGIGANSAIFSVVNTILLRPLGYRDSDRLVWLNHHYPKLKLKASVSAVGYQHYREVNKSFDDMGAFMPWAANLTENGEPERLQGMLVTASLFSTLGAEAAKGRVLLPEENQAGRNHVVVIGDGLWHRRFGADPNLLGKTVTLNGENYTIIGIMPPSFQFGREVGQETELWGPITFTPDQLQPNRWRSEFLAVVMRLKPNVTFGQAQADFDTIAANVRQQFFGGGPGNDAGSWNLALQPLREMVIGDIRDSLLMLMAAVGFVLLIACANVANLLLARAAARQKEIAIRAALGASRARMMRQLLTESVLLALVGGGAGLLLAYWGVKLLLTLNQGNIPRSQEFNLDTRVLAFTFIVALLTGILFGLVPALHSSKTDLHDTLKEGGRSGSGGTRRTVRGLLVVTEMALALVLLVGAGLLIKSFWRLQEVSPGFRPENVLAMQISLPNFKYRDPQQIDAFYQQAVQQVSALPGVQAAGVSSSLPMSGNNSSASFAIEGRQVGPGETSPWGNRWLAGATYFQTMGIPLIKGRFFTERDTAESQDVVIVDETLARKYWPNEDAVGKRISFQRDAQGNPRWREVVGIVGHVKHRGLEGESPVQYYIPNRQIPGSTMFLVVRTAAEPTSMAATVRGVIRTIDKDLPVFRATTMERMVSESMAQRRFSMILLVVFAAVALVLAAVGLYGVLSYSVTQRTHEIGIRMALGAKRSEVFRLVVGQGMLLALIGLGIGLVAAFALTTLIANLLFGVNAKDPMIFTAIAGLLTLVALIACYIPAWRATKVDPMVALRYE